MPTPDDGSTAPQPQPQTPTEAKDSAPQQEADEEDEDWPSARFAHTLTQWGVEERYVLFGGISDQNDFQDLRELRLLSDHPQPFSLVD